MPSFGTSEARVFSVRGPIKLGQEVDEICPTCEHSLGGPYKFKVYAENHRSITLMCPNCGETKTVFPAEVVKPFGDVASPTKVVEAPKPEASVPVAVATKPARGRPKGSKNKPKAPAKAPAKTKAKAPAKAGSRAKASSKAKKRT